MTGLGERVKPALREEFYRGRYRQILARSFDSRLGRWKPRDTSIVIGTLAFVGRLGEAELLFAQRRESLPANQEVEARFFLGVGFTRQSQYARARRYFALNLKGAASGGDSVSRFYGWQGVSFYRYFSGRLQTALRTSAHAQEAAIQGGFLYGKFLAMDLRGHILVQLGEVSEGLSMLAQARETSKLLADGAVREEMDAAILVYRSQFGLDGARAPQLLQDKLQSLSNQDTYTRSGLLLELSRQLLLRGRIDQASARLDEAAPIIYATHHRRHEAQLNLRYAHLYYLSGEYSQALRFVRSGKRGLDPAVDHLLDLALSGMEAKVTGALGLKDLEFQARQRIEALSQLYGGIINQRIVQRHAGQHVSAGIRKNLDPLGDLLDTARGAHDSETGEVVEEILKSDCLVLLYELLGVEHGVRTLYLDLIPGGLTTFDRGRVVHSMGLTPLLRKVLTRLHNGGVSKKELVEQVWDYRYHPLRHDAVVYSAITILRRLLGAHGSWIETTEEGYRLAPDLRLASDSQARATPARARSSVEGGSFTNDLTPLNYRQIKLLRYLDQHDSVDLQTCKKLFKVSGITASRDLSALTASKHVLRIGRGRATQYSKPGRLGCNIRFLRV